MHLSPISNTYIRELEASGKDPDLQGLSPRHRETLIDESTAQIATHTIKLRSYTLSFDSQSGKETINLFKGLVLKALGKFEAGATNCRPLKAPCNHNANS